MLFGMSFLGALLVLGLFENCSLEEPLFLVWAACLCCFAFFGMCLFGLACSLFVL